jgi:hypothetical protein
MMRFITPQMKSRSVNQTRLGVEKSISDEYLNIITVLSSNTT